MNAKSSGKKKSVEPRVRSGVRDENVALQAERTPTLRFGVPIAQNFASNTASNATLTDDVQPAQPGHSEGNERSEAKRFARRNPVQGRGGEAETQRFDRRQTVKPDRVDSFRRKIFALVLLIGAIGNGYLIWSNWDNHQKQQVVVDDYYDLTNQMSDQKRYELVEDLKKYNELIKAERQPTESDDLPSIFNTNVHKNPDDPGPVFGVLTIPKIDLKLPIYMGTSDAQLNRGLGILEGTSLPYGGDSTHSVITGHRGLSLSKLFTDLPKLSVGDVFYIDMAGERHAYQVREVNVVNPDDIRLLTIRPGDDLISLFTCTPLGINTHRFVATAARAPDFEVERDGSSGMTTLWIPFAIFVLLCALEKLLTRKARLWWFAYGLLTFGLGWIFLIWLKWPIQKNYIDYENVHRYSPAKEYLDSNPASSASLHTLALDSYGRTGKPHRPLNDMGGLRVTGSRSHSEEIKQSEAARYRRRNPVQGHGASAEFLPKDNNNPNITNTPHHLPSTRDSAKHYIPSNEDVWVIGPMRKKTKPGRIVKLKVLVPICSKHRSMKNHLKCEECKQLRLEWSPKTDKAQKRCKVKVKAIVTRIWAYEKDEDETTSKEVWEGESKVVRKDYASLLLIPYRDKDEDFLKQKFIQVGWHVWNE